MNAKYKINLTKYKLNAIFKLMMNIQNNIK